MESFARTHLALTAAAAVLLAAPAVAAEPEPFDAPVPTADAGEPEFARCAAATLLYRTNVKGADETTLRNLEFSYESFLLALADAQAERTGGEGMKFDGEEVMTPEVREAVQTQAHRYLANVKGGELLGAESATAFLQGEIARCSEILEGLADDGA